MKIYPFDQVAKNASDHAKAGHSVYQQFLCAGCGVKQTMDVPNVFYTKGTCQECSHITNIRKDGCNFMLHIGMK